MQSFLKRGLAVSAIALSSFLQSVAATPLPTSWELSGQFNPFYSTNANWSYGWKPTSLSQPLPFWGPYTPSGAPNILLLQPSPSNPSPLIAWNQDYFATTWGLVTLPPRGVLLHPGPAGERATVSFKAPYPAQYRVSGQFYGLDDSYGVNGSTHTAVRVVKASASNPLIQTLFAVNVMLPSQGQASFTSKIVMLYTGDRLDFDVGVIPNLSSPPHAYGSTGLHAVIERIGDYCKGVGSGSDC